MSIGTGDGLGDRLRETRWCVGIFVGPSVSFGVGSDIDTDVGFEGSLLIGAGVGLIERSGVGMGVGRALGLGRVGEGAGTLDGSAVGSGVGRGLRRVGRPQSQTNVHDREACPGRPCNLSQGRLLFERFGHLVTDSERAG